VVPGYRARAREPPIQHDLLVAVQRGQTYWDCFPSDAGFGLRDRLDSYPLGLSWRNTLPGAVALVDR
jgi:hypothetical protein